MGRYWDGTRWAMTMSVWRSSLLNQLVLVLWYRNFIHTAFCVSRMDLSSTSRLIRQNIKFTSVSATCSRNNIFHMLLYDELRRIYISASKGKVSHLFITTTSDRAWIVRLGWVGMTDVCVSQVDDFISSAINTYRLEKTLILKLKVSSVWPYSNC